MDYVKKLDNFLYQLDTFIKQPLLGRTIISFEGQCPGFLHFLENQRTFINEAKIIYSNNQNTNFIKKFIYIENILIKIKDELRIDEMLPILFNTNNFDLITYLSQIDKYDPEKLLIRISGHLIKAQNNRKLQIRLYNFLDTKVPFKKYGIKI